MAKEKKQKANSEEAKILLENSFQEFLKENNNDYSYICNNLGKKLKECKDLVYESILPNILDKWCSEETKPLWLEMIKNPKMLEELNTIGVSIANTMRPVAGNTFADWVCKILNKMFDENKMNLKCQTTGEYKKQINEQLKGLKEFVNETTGEITKMDQKPDIDIVVYHKIKKKSVCIISCKTTLAERVMQTISWQSYISNVLEDYTPVYLATAWEDFIGNKIAKERVQSLAGVFVCNENVEEYGNIKIFSKIIDEFKKFE